LNRYEFNAIIINSIATHKQLLNRVRTTIALRPILVGGLTYIVPTTKLYRSRWRPI